VSTNETIQLMVNGETRGAPGGVTIQSLLELLELDPSTVAVELDRRIVKPQDWPATSLCDGAQLEIVHFVGGG
jgi:sulfur carrier protein